VFGTALVREHDYKLGEQFVYLILHSVAETVDGVEVRLFVACQPYKMYVMLQGFLYLAA